MPEYLHHDSIDKAKWDACIMHSINRNAGAFSWYLDALVPQWDAIIEGDYEAVMPLPCRRKFGVKYIFQPPFAQQLGVFSSTITDSSSVKEFLKAIPASFRVADINLNKWLRLESGPWSIKENTNYELELIPFYDDLYNGYSENLKRNLQKARKAGLKRQGGISPQEIINLFRNNRGAGIRTLGDKDYSALLRLMYQLMHRGMARLLGTCNERNELTAAAVILEDTDRSVFLFSGVSAEGRQSKAMPWLIDSYIREYAGTQRIFDFEGSNDPGLARFYASFGSQSFKYQSIRINRLPFPLRQVHAFYSARRA